MLLALTLLSYPILSAAYTWNFGNTPSQCTNLTITVSGSDGKPPYRVLIIPSGPPPLPNGIEARKIVDLPFDTDTSISFQLKYPANSQFVAVVSDSSGFGSGGVSAAAQVTSSSDSSCFDSTKSVQAPWTYSINPAGTLIQCVSTRIYWNDPSKVKGTPKFLGVIPGGKAFTIPTGSITDQSANGLGTGFSWTPSVRGGTEVFLVAGDDTGTGSGGSNPFTVQNGNNNDVSCLNAQSPSSTAGNPAGGSYPTNASGGSTGGSDSSSGTNVGAIVGGVIGGIVLVLAFVLVLIFLRRRDRYRKRYSEKPTVDLAAADEEDEAPARASRNELPQYYQPEPFIAPDPTTATQSEFGGLDANDPNRHSYASNDTSDLLSASGGQSTTTTSRKGGYQRSMRPVNIIQHDDAGPSVPKEEEAETIELPPAYTKIRRDGEAVTPGSENTQLGTTPPPPPPGVAAPAMTTTGPRDE